MEAKQSKSVKLTTLYLKKKRLLVTAVIVLLK